MNKEKKAAPENAPSDGEISALSDSTSNSRDGLEQHTNHPAGDLPDETEGPDAGKHGSVTTTTERSDKDYFSCLVVGDMTIVHQRVIASRNLADALGTGGNIESELQSRFGTSYLLEEMLAACSLNTFPRTWYSSVNWEPIEKHAPRYAVLGPSTWRYPRDPAPGLEALGNDMTWDQMAKLVNDASGLNEPFKEANADRTNWNKRGNLLAKVQEYYKDNNAFLQRTLKGANFESQLNRMPITQFDITNVDRSSSVDDKQKALRIEIDRTVTTATPEPFVAIPLEKGCFYSLPYRDDKDDKKRIIMARYHVAVLAININGEGFLSLENQQILGDLALLTKPNAKKRKKEKEQGNRFAGPICIKYKVGHFPPGKFLKLTPGNSSDDGEPNPRKAIVSNLSQFLSNSRRNRDPQKPIIVQLRASDVRHYDVSISRGRSWERTVQDTLRAVNTLLLEKETEFNFLQYADYIVVSFSPDAAIVIKKPLGYVASKDTGEIADSQKPLQAWLIAPPDGIEGDMFRIYPGQTRGYETALSTAICNWLMDVEGVSLIKAIPEYQLLEQKFKTWRSLRNDLLGFSKQISPEPYTDNKEEWQQWLDRALDETKKIATTGSSQEAELFDAKIKNIEDLPSLFRTCVDTIETKCPIGIFSDLAPLDKERGLAAIVMTCLDAPTEEHSAGLVGAVKAGLHAARFLQARGFTPVVQTPSRRDSNTVCKDDESNKWKLKKAGISRRLAPANEKIQSLHYPLDVMGQIIRSGSDLRLSDAILRRSLLGNREDSLRASEASWAAIAQGMEEAGLNGTVWVPDRLDSEYLKPIKVLWEKIEEVFKEFAEQASIDKLAAQELNLAARLEELKDKVEDDEFLTHLKEFDLFHVPALKAGRIFKSNFLHSLRKLVACSSGEEFRICFRDVLFNFNKIEKFCKEHEDLLRNELIYRLKPVLVRVEDDWRDASNKLTSICIPEDGIKMSNKVREKEDVGPRRQSEQWHRKYNWNFLDGTFIVKGSGNNDPEKAAMDAARMVLRDGLPALDKLRIPYHTSGQYVAVERWEIESVREMSMHLMEYFQKPISEKPFNAGVFGPPGAGKGFLVKNLVSAIDSRQKTEFMTFNLSQLGSPDEIFKALHKVNDVALRGKIPIVMWDEFDANLTSIPFGWLKYFLAPMQDGEFQEGQITHKVARSVFCFAGGRFNSREIVINNLFVNDVDPRFVDAVSQAGRNSIRKDSEKLKIAEELRASKGMDFFSRLTSVVELGSLDPGEEEPGGSKYCYLFRRALLIRSLLAAQYPHLKSDSTMQVSEPVCNYLLKDAHYRHGSRSVEAILKLSEITQRTSFLSVDLPSDREMGWHIGS